MFSQEWYRSAVMFFPGAEDDDAVFEVFRHLQSRVDTETIIEVGGLNERLCFAKVYFVSECGAAIDCAREIIECVMVVVIFEDAVDRAERICSDQCGAWFGVGTPDWQ